MTSYVTERDVRLAYRLLLNREPESEEIVRELAGRIENVEELRAFFVRSPEYQEKAGGTSRQLHNAYWHKRRNIDVEVAPAAFATLVERTRQQWAALGEADPYWSVLTHDNYHKDRLTEEALREFYESGRQACGLLDIFAERTDVALPRGTCLELGCGVGRITRHLADRFDRVIAVDISAGNLTICRDYLAKEGVTNVETRLITTPQDLGGIGPIDCFYSVIVLQHNPPPIQKALLELILSRIVPGGVFLFQTPDTYREYDFKETDVGHLDEQTMDMHCLPKVFILSMLRAIGLEIRDVLIDPWTGVFGSYTYFGQKV